MSTKQLASLMIKISANGAQAQKELSTLETKVKDFGKSMQSIGASMTKYVTVPLTALAGLSVKTANTQLQAEGRLLTALKNRKDVQQRLISQAQEIQSRTTYGDEAIIEQQAYLAALGLTEEQIRDTIEASVQLSAALGIELESAVRNLAKTYSGMTGELGESMPALKALTEEQLKSGEAIRLVNQEYKGFAEAAAKTGAGPLEQLKNKFGDMAEKLGTALLPIITKLADWLGKLADWFNNLSPATQEIIANMVALAAALGPVLSIGGKLLTLIPKIGAAFTAATSPIGALVTTLAALLAGYNAIKNAMDGDTQEEEEERLERKLREAEARDVAKDRAYKKGYEEGKKRINDLAAGKDPYEAYMAAKAYVYGTSWKEDSEWFKDLQRMNAELADLKQKQSDDWREVGAEYEGIMAGVNDAYAKLYSAYFDPEFKRMEPDIEALKEQQLLDSMGIIERLQYQISKINDALPFYKTEEEIAAANDELAELNKKLEYYYSLSKEVSKEGATGPIEQASLINTSPISWGVSGVKDLGIIDMLSSYDADKWREQMIAKAQKMADVVNEMNSIISAALANMVSGIGNYLEALISGDEFKPLVALLSMIGETLKQLGSALVAYAVSLEAFKKAFSNPWAALAAGAAAIVAGSAVMGWAKRMEKTTKLATGGLAYGPTMAIVGDNPGASNDPEVIAPLSKLRDYMGAQRLQLIGDVTFEIAGDTMRAVLNRENVRLSTLG